MMRSIRVLGVLLASALVVAACGADDDEGGWGELTTTTTTTTPEPAEDDRSSLTGLPVDAEIRERPIVAVKIDNHPRAAPQVGLAEADVVYEIEVEGSQTRFVSLYQSRDAENLGPVRSVRMSELGILEHLGHPLLVWHGGSPAISAEARAASIHPRSISDIAQLFYRDGSRPGPHNSFLQATAAVRDTAPDGAQGPDWPIFTFGEADEPASPHAEPASAVEVHFSASQGGSAARYDWDADAERWLRSQRGAPHVDVEGEQIAVDNVIVRFSEADWYGSDSSGSLVPHGHTVGEGEAWVFTRATVTQGTWHKPDLATPTEFLDADGEPILLNPGQTWVEIPFAKNGSHFG